MPSLSAVIITHNEESNIGRCLQSLKGVADEVVVIDAYSSDRTEAICRSLGARFIQHAWEGYSRSRNFGNIQASNDWVFYLDADEELSDELKQSILAVKENPKTLFLRCNVMINYCGKWIHHTGWYPGTKLRFFDRRVARWEGDVHEKIIPDQEASIGFLKGDVLHYAYKSIEEHKRKNEKYSTLMAEELFRKGKKISRLSVLPRAWFTFFKFYFLKLGFFDGYYGFVISRLVAQYTRMKYEKLLALYQEK